MEFRNTLYINISQSTAPWYDVPNPYSVPGCTCLPNESPKLFRGKVQFKLSLERICGGQEARLWRSNRSKARKEKFARIPIYIAHRESVLLFPLSYSWIVLFDIVIVTLLIFRYQILSLFKSVAKKVVD